MTDIKMKTLFNQKFDFENFVKLYTKDRDPYHGKIVSQLEEPEKYPCVLVYEIKVDDNGPDYIDGEYVYLDNFDLDNNI